jgi:hypothetical protein
MSLSIALAAALALAVPQDPPAALTDQQSNDLFCVAAYAMAAGQDASVAATVAPGLFFYLGRLEGRDPEVDWLEQLAERAQGWSVEQVNDARAGCDQVIGERAMSLVQVGSRMSGDE